MEDLQLIEQFIAGKPNPQRRLLLALHKLLLTYTGIRAKMRYKIPFYDGNYWICYVNPLKNGGVELVFTRAKELLEVAELIHFKDRKLMAGIEIYKLDQQTVEAIDRVMQQALVVDATAPPKQKKPIN